MKMKVLFLFVSVLCLTETTLAQRHSKLKQINELILKIHLDTGDNVIALVSGSILTAVQHGRRGQVRYMLAYTNCHNSVNFNRLS